MLSLLMRCSVSLFVAVALLSLTVVAVSSSSVSMRYSERTAAAAAIKTPAQKIIEAVPIAERTSFILYQLARALDETRNEFINAPGPRMILPEAVMPSKEVEKFKDIPTYKSFAPDLLNWVMEDFSVSTGEVYGMLRDINIMLCTPNGLCFSGEDMGSFCCPF